MHVIAARNVNNALQKGIDYLLDFGVEEPSRNGPVLVAPVPVTTMYHCPDERVLFSPLRDANPFFHFFEALWMLAGRNDLELPLFFNSKFGAYSDDGKTVRGAYGYRWRHWFGYDQLATVIEQLRQDPSSRRAVLAMWDAGAVAYGNGAYQWPEKGDLLVESVDKPCNTHIYFRVVDCRLDMTVCCRSNDIYWGAYGANAVHMSMLQEFVASSLGLRMGTYYQVSNNFHLYTNVLSREKATQVATECGERNHYYAPNHIPYPLFHGMQGTPVENMQVWVNELRSFLKNPSGPRNLPFFEHVAAPMYALFMTYKNGNRSTASSLVEDDTFISAPDWRRAANNWILRRMFKE